MTIPVWIMFIHGFATGYLTTWLGLVLVNIHPSIRKLTVVGLGYAVGAMIIRSIPMLFGLHFYLLTILLIFFVKWMWSLPLIKALIPVILGNLIMALGEAFFLSAYLEILNTDISTFMGNNTNMLLGPLPQIIFILLLIWFVSRQNIFILNFDYVPHQHPEHIQKNKLLFILAAMVLILMLFQAVCIDAIYNNTHPIQVYQGISLEILGIVMSLALTATTLIILYLLVRLIKLVNQESQFMVQQTYLETVDEMITAIRAQQHDQISHLQALYGYLQLEYFSEARLYLEDMIGEIKFTQQFATIADPGLSALTYTKTRVAISNGITFDISVNTDLEYLSISPYELTRILGNLINNSFDYVNNLNEDMKHVWFRVDREDNYYIFEVANYGHIDDHLASKIFSKGFTSKDGDHAGLGLSIVEGLVNHHGGKIVFNNEHDKVIFTVFLPIKEFKHDAIRQDVGSSAGQKLFGKPL